MKKVSCLLLSVLFCFLIGCNGVSKSTTGASSKTNSAKESSENTANSNLYTFEHVTLSLPEGFTVDTESSVPVAKPADFPKRTDNIVFAKTGADSSKNYTQKVLDDYYAKSVTGFEKSTGFDILKIDKTDVIKYSYTLTVNDIAQRQTQYMIFGKDYSNIITFTSVSGDFDAEFIKTAKSIKIK